jgi:hypothetical protein
LPLLQEPSRELSYVNNRNAENKPKIRTKLKSKEQKSIEKNGKEGKRKDDLKRRKK